MSNRLDPDQARHFFEPDLGPKCVHRLSTDNSSRQRVKVDVVLEKVNWMVQVTGLQGHYKKGVKSFSYQVNS